MNISISGESRDKHEERKIISYSSLFSHFIACYIKINEFPCHHPHTGNTHPDTHCVIIISLFLSLSLRYFPNESYTLLSLLLAFVLRSPFSVDLKIFLSAETHSLHCFDMCGEKERERKI
jgi:hypothetical protein